MPLSATNYDDVGADDDVIQSTSYVNDDDDDYMLGE